MSSNLLVQRKFVQGTCISCSDNSLSEGRPREEVYVLTLSQPIVLLKKLEHTPEYQQLRNKTKTKSRKRKSSLNKIDHKIKKTRFQTRRFAIDDDKSLTFFQRKHNRSNDHQTNSADGIHADSHYLRRNTNRSEDCPVASTSKSAGIISTERKHGSNDHQTNSADGIHADSHYLRRNTNRSEDCPVASTSKSAGIISTERKHGSNDHQTNSADGIHADSHYLRRNTNRSEDCPVASTSKSAGIISTERKHDSNNRSNETDVMVKIHHLGRNTTRSEVIKKSKAKKSSLNHSINKNSDSNNRSNETDVMVKIHHLGRNTTRSEVIKKSKAKKSSLNHSINKNSESNNLLENNTNMELAVFNPIINTTISEDIKESNREKSPAIDLNITSEVCEQQFLVQRVDVQDTMEQNYVQYDNHLQMQVSETPSTSTYQIYEQQTMGEIIHVQEPVEENHEQYDNDYQIQNHDHKESKIFQNSLVQESTNTYFVPSSPEEVHVQDIFVQNHEHFDNDCQVQDYDFKESIIEIHDNEQPTHPQLNTVAQFTTPQIAPPRILRQPVITEDFGGSSRLQGRLSLSAPSPCPSESLSTVKEVLQAPRVTLDNRCRNCRHCQRINKVYKITNLMQRTRDPVDRARVVSESDSSSEIIISTTPTQRTHTQTLKTMYLDLLPSDNGHIIEISTVKVDNRTEPIIQAKLINKSKVDNIQDLNLVEHENLFDQVLQTLNMSQLVSATSGSQQTVETVNETSDSIRNVGNTAIPSNDGRQVLPDQPEAHCSHTNTQPITRISCEKSSQSRKSADSLPNCQESGFPKKADSAKCVDAPIFYPSETEFSDPITYFEKIMPKAAKFGLCKVVAPAGFKPTCHLGEKIKFTVTNQYIARLYSRWGPAAREMSAIKAYLATQGVKFTRPPLLDGVEVNLAKLYHIVQRYGGLKNVTEKKRWTKVAEELGLKKDTNPEKKLEQIYVRYLLPYDTLSNQERQQTMSDVEKCWNKKNNKMLDRALNPLQRQKILLGESDSSEDESEDESEIAGALAEAEDCVVPGRSMNLVTFKKIASNVMNTHILTSSSTVTPATVEDIYWRHVLLGTEHVCVNTASIDTGEEGYGFTKNKSDPYGIHPWNLKMLSHNSGNVLHSLGAVQGVTVPTLHFGMVFSTSCWHRDPHGLPWVEYMHTGAGKIWYGIPNEESQNFRQAVEKLCPAHCQNKQIWLSSDIIMVPPRLMMEQNMSLSRVIQNPGEFVIVFPKAYSSSICTGYTISESVYFATKSWLNTVTQDFQEVRDSCEPTMFSLEQLLIAAGRDTRASLAVVQQVHSVLTTIINNELKDRRALERLRIQNRPQKLPKKHSTGSSNVRELHDCEFCRGTPMPSTSRPRKLPKKLSTGSRNVREKDHCEICRATLYLSQVTGLPDKKSSVCLHHALRLLETPKHKNRNLSSLALTCFYTDAELQDIINAVQERLLH